MEKEAQDEWNVVLATLGQADQQLSSGTYERLIHAARKLANIGIDRGLDRVELPPRALELLVDLASGVQQRPAAKPPMRPIDKLRHWNTTRLRLASRDIDRYKDVWRKRYGQRKAHDKALEKAAERWLLDKRQLERFYKGAKERD